MLSPAGLECRRDRALDHQAELLATRGEILRDRARIAAERHAMAHELHSVSDAARERLRRKGRQ
jgi:hypothetical protein